MVINFLFCKFLIGFKIEISVKMFIYVELKR